MPEINTLVQDIYNLFGKNEIEFSAHLFEDFGKKLGEVVADRFSKEEREPNHLRMSNIGRPDRQLWYDINYKGQREELQGSTYVKFMYGDLIEHMVLMLARQAGHDVKDEQKEVEIDGIKGHIDAIVDGILVDVKSASTFSFQKFVDGSLLADDPFGYVAQLAGYNEAVNPEGDAGFLAVDKTLGKLHLMMIPNAVLKQYRVRERIKHVKQMVAVEAIPARCYDDKPDGKSGNRILRVGCSYCGHKEHCWKDANDGRGLIAYAYSSGPRFFTHIEREPKVDQF